MIHPRSTIGTRAARSAARDRRSLGALVPALLLLTVATTDSSGVNTRFFTTQGYDGFKQCTLEGVALSDDGRAFAGPEARSLGDPGVRTVWALALDSKGRIVFSTGDEGQVFRTDGESEPQVLATLYNYELFALATDAKGNAYAAGAPAGAIVRIDPTGKTETVFDVPEGLVFDLLAAPDGTLYAAAGERGRLYRLPVSGEPQVVMESGDLHLRCLAWSTDGRKIWAGTDGRGLVQAIDPKSGSARIAYDAPEDEIVSILPLPDGGLYFAANPNPAGAKAPGSGHGSAGDPDVSGGPGPASDGTHPILYRMDARGSVRPVWQCPEKVIHDLLLEDAGTVLVATGAAGALYRVHADGSETVLWRADEEQVLSLLEHRGVIYAGTGNPGRVYRVGPGPGREAMLTSEVLDAGDQSIWGMLSWRADGKGDRIGFETRSGFTEVPDTSWSEWAAVAVEPSGSQIPSPPGRYLQWRASFPGVDDSSAALRVVRIAHVEANRPPQIGAISLSPEEPVFRSDHGGGSVSQTLPGGVQVDYSLAGGRNNTLPPAGIPAWLREIRSIVWQADDPDGDDLRFTLEIRQVGDKEFRLIEDDWDEPAYTLTTGSLPDGMYEIRITATDLPSNTPGTELTASRTTPPFQIDNVPPTVVDLKARRIEGPALEISGRAVDSTSPLRHLAVSIDGGEFRGIPPSDGLMDSVEERFRVQLPLDSEKAGNWVVVQVRDAAGNEGSYRAWLEP
jgi:hypothetical protein